MKWLSLTAPLRTPRHVSECTSLLGLSIVVAALTSSSVASAATRYVFATFLGDDASKENLSLYTSKNGVDFTLLANTGFAGPTNVLRDPSIMKHTDGRYYIAYTLKSWTTTSASFAACTPAGGRIGSSGSSEASIGLGQVDADFSARKEMC